MNERPSPFSIGKSYSFSCYISTIAFNSLFSWRPVTLLRSNDPLSFSSGPSHSGLRGSQTHPVVVCPVSECISGIGILSNGWTLHVSWRQGCNWLVTPRSLHWASARAEHNNLLCSLIFVCWQWLFCLSPPLLLQSALGCSCGDVKGSGHRIGMEVFQIQVICTVWSWASHFPI